MFLAFVVHIQHPGKGKKAVAAILYLIFESLVVLFINQGFVSGMLLYVFCNDRTIDYEF